MAYEITLPRLGWDMVEGALAGWLKAEGEWVEAGELLFNVEGDKAVQEIEALDSGYLRRLPDGPSEGQKVAVGTVLGYLVPKAEVASFVFPSAAAAAVVAEAPAVAPAAPALPTGAPAETRRVYISPLARRRAEALGIDWRSLRGSGWQGRIKAQDVEACAAQARPAPVAPPPVAPTAASRAPLTATRRQIADHMAYSAHTAAPVTLTTEADATELVRLRAALKRQGGVIPTYNDLLAKLCAQALLDFPALNARLEGNEIVQLAAADIALAVDTERGLLAPVLRDVQAKSLRQVAREAAALIEQARAGKLAYADLQGASFTITNLGMFEIDAFTPIIDLPQCAILGVGRIHPKQVVLDFERAELGLRQMVALSLTFDHRLNDGAGAARFLQRIKQYLADPYLWLAG